jgi:DNA-binding LacI/PurR family transcriptional regulator
LNIFNEISIDPERGSTIINQLKEQITWLMASGKLKTGDQLPPIKIMAKELNINLQTVRIAYQRMEMDGLVTTRQGRGTHVLSFNPLQFAKQASTQRSHTIGVIIPSWTNPFYHAVLQGVEEVAEQMGMLLLLSNAHDDPHEAWRNFAMLTARGVEGILLVSHDVSEYLDGPPDGKSHPTPNPFVTVDFPKTAGYSVNLDLLSAGRQAAQHLLEHGHERIGVITFNPQSDNVCPLLDAFEQVIDLEGKKIPLEYKATVSDFSQASGREAANRLIAMEHRPTAIFAIADLLALGAMQAIKERGLKIPQDVALVSFNDIPAASLVEPRITSVSVPAVQLGREAMKMLKTLMEGKQPADPHFILPVKLIVRESCGMHSVEKKGG